MARIKSLVLYLVIIIGLILVSWLGNYYYIVYYLLFLALTFVLLLHSRKVKNFSPVLVADREVMRKSIRFQFAALLIVLMLSLVFLIPKIQFLDLYYLFAGFMLFWITYLLIEYKLYQMLKKSSEA